MLAADSGDTVCIALATKHPAVKGDYVIEIFNLELKDEQASIQLSLSHGFMPSPLYALSFLCLSLFFSVCLSFVLKHIFCFLLRVRSHSW